MTSGAHGGTLWWRHYVKAWKRYLAYLQAVEFEQMVESSIMDGVKENMARDIDKQMAAELKEARRPEREIS